MNVGSTIGHRRDEQARLERDRQATRLRRVSAVVLGLLVMLGLLALANGGDGSKTPSRQPGPASAAMQTPDAAVATGLEPDGGVSSDKPPARENPTRRHCVPPADVRTARSAARAYKQRGGCHRQIVAAWLDRIHGLDAAPNPSREDIWRLYALTRTLLSTAGRTLSAAQTRDLEARRRRLAGKVEENRRAFLVGFEQDESWQGKLSLKLKPAGDELWDIAARWQVSPIAWKNIAEDRTARDNLLVYFVDRIARRTHTSGFRSHIVRLVMLPSDGGAERLRLHLETDCARKFRELALDAPFERAIAKLNTCVSITLPEGW